MKKFPLLIIVTCILFSCAGLDFLSKKPEVSLKRVDIDSITLKDLTFLFEIELHNPYPLGFTLEDVGFAVAVEGSRLFSTRTKKGVVVKAGGIETTPVKVQIPYDGLLKVVKNYRERDRLNCSIDVDCVIPLPKALHSIKKSITFKRTVERSIPALKPSIRVLSAGLKAPSLEEIKKAAAEAGKKSLDSEALFRSFTDLISGKEAPMAKLYRDLDVPISLTLDVEVRNDTKASFSCRDLSYDFSIAGRGVISGSSREVSNEGRRSVIRIVNTFSSRALGESAYALFKSREGSYRLKGASSVKFPDEIKSSPLRLDFDETGRFALK
ncbi:MAG: hypothetical protein JW838_07260 [Spirochaetes bacterium]|nr:hypothetical protein [Spirochaetota bacterium]